MPYVNTVPEHRAAGNLKAMYERAREAGRAPSNLMTAQSLRPDVMEQVFGLARRLLYGESGLTRVQREMLATAVSAINRCQF